MDDPTFLDSSTVVETDLRHKPKFPSQCDVNKLEGDITDFLRKAIAQATLKGLTNDQIKTVIANVIARVPALNVVIKELTPNHFQLTVNQLTLNIQGNQMSQETKIEKSTVTGSQIATSGGDSNQSMKTEPAPDDMVSWKDFAADVKSILTALVDAKQALEWEIADLRKKQKENAVASKETQLALFDHALSVAKQMQGFEQTEKTMEQLKSDVDDLFVKEYDDSFSKQLGHWPDTIRKIFTDPKVIGGLLALAGTA